MANIVENLSQAEIEDKIQELREWLETEPELPNDLGRFARIALILINGN